MLAPRDLLIERLARHGLLAPSSQPAARVVAWMGAVQAQQYNGAAWALALRSPGLTLADVDEALRTGAIIRTHILRPTWHFVSPGSLRWMLMLTGPRVLARLRPYDAKLGLDAAIYRRARRSIERALAASEFQTRVELAAALASAGIPAEGDRLANLLIDAEANGLICSGPRVGAQFTYRLVDKLIPPAAALSRDEALAMLADVYSQSHGPATVEDFAWWSGLLLSDARLAFRLAGVESDLAARAPGVIAKSGGCYLLPLYDEFLIAYRRPAATWRFNPVVCDGQPSGSWRVQKGGRQFTIEVALSRPATKKQNEAMRRAALAYAQFMGVECSLRMLDVGGDVWGRAGVSRPGASVGS